jgi:phosphotransferase system IIB component
MKFSKIYGIFVFAFIGCSSTKPLTQNIINDVGGNDEIEKFQYYVSTRITLNDAKKIRDQQDISKFGAAAITDIVYNNRIIIDKSTMGVAIKKYYDEKNNLTLEVCFEEDDDKRIIFKQDGNGADREFHIVYQNSFTRTIDYGGELYTVDYYGDRPYLRVKVSKRLKEKIKTKWAKGRRVQG